MRTVVFTATFLSACIALAGDANPTPVDPSEDFQRYKGYLRPALRNRSAADANATARNWFERDLASEVADARSTGESPPAVVVSGGISLGAYQAGFISTLVRFWAVMEEREGIDALPRVWTGASAGAVNALLGGLSGCDPDLRRSTPWKPEESQFWNVWIGELDLEKLLPLKYGNRTNHLFSDPHMQQVVSKIAQHYQSRQLTPDCSFAYGVAATNLAGRDIAIGNGNEAKLKRVTEKIAVQVHTNRENKLSARLPLLGPESPTDSPTGSWIEVHYEDLPYYTALSEQEPESRGTVVPLELLFAAPRASGAFPVAFPPVKLGVWHHQQNKWSQVVFDAVDGGVLSNNPVDLAHRLGTHWREDGGKFNREAFPVIYVDQDFVDWEWATPSRPEQKKSPLEETYLGNLGNLVSAATSSIVLETLENHPDLSRRLKIPRRSRVLPSEFRFAMLGFSDPRYRKHDFYVGMKDAVSFIVGQLGSSDISYGLTESDILGVLNIESDGFDCVVRDACPSTATAENWQLWRLARASEALTNMAQQNTLEKDDLDVFLAQLANVGFTRCDETKGGQPHTGDRSELASLRKRVGRAFHDLMSRQSGGLRLAGRPAGVAFLDEWLTYTPPKWAAYFTGGSQRGISLGWEFPLAASDGDRSRTYNRAELRWGLNLGGGGRRYSEQTVPGKARIRELTAGMYLDWVSDVDGFAGRVSWARLGPYVRWRAGVGISTGTLDKFNSFATDLDLRLGVDLLEFVGLRIIMPVVSHNAARGVYEDFLNGTGVSATLTYTHW